MKYPLVKEMKANRLISTGLKAGSESTYSLDEFLESIAKLAANFVETEHVINLCTDRLSFLQVFCATLIAGKTNIHPPNRQIETLRTLITSYPDTLIVGEEDIDVEEMNYSRLDTLNNHQSDYGNRVELKDISSDHIAAIAFTSGSTGKPVANTKIWGSLVGTTHKLASRFGFYNIPPTIVGTVPSQHMYGLEMTIMMGLHGDATLQRSIPFFPKDIVNTLSINSEKTVLVTTPVHLRALADSGLNVPSLAKIISATAPLPDKLAEKSELLCSCTLEEIYGFTEAGSVATRRTLDGPDWELLSGMRLDNAMSLHAEHLPMPVEFQDEIRVISDTRFEFIGRNQDMINVGGKRFSLADLGNKLLEIEGVSDAIAILPPSTKNMIERPAALVVSDISEKEIAIQLRNKIDPVFIPRPMKRVKSIPRNETGKVSHSQLLSLFEQLNKDKKPS